MTTPKDPGASAPDPSKNPRPESDSSATRGPGDAAPRPADGSAPLPRISIPSSGNLPLGPGQARTGQSPSGLERISIPEIPQPSARSQLPPLDLPRNSGQLSPPREKQMLLISALVSFLVHGLIFFFLYHRALGSFDPSYFTEYLPVQVYREPEQDHIVDDLPPPTELKDPTQIASAGNPGGSDHNKTPGQLSAQMLAAGAPAGRSVLTDWTAILPPMKLRGITDQPTEELKNRPVGSAGPVEIPSDLAQRLLSGPEVKLPSVPLRGPVVIEEGNVAIVGGEGSGQGFADQLLSSVGRGGLQRKGTPDGSDRGIGNPALDSRPPGMGGGGLGLGAGGGAGFDFAGVPLRPTPLGPVEALDEDFEYRLTIYDPRTEKEGFSLFASKPKDDRGYCRIDVTPKRSLRRLHTMPKDVVLIVDTSESVPQFWVDAVTAGIRDGLSSLNPTDRFNIVFFNEKVATFQPEGLAPVNEQTLRDAQQFLTRARSVGYTDMNKALTRLLVRDVAVERVYDIILFSDGRPTRGVLDTRELINLITHDNDLAASIYCVGIGVQQNHELLEFLAYRNKGFCSFVDEPQAAPIAIRNLLSRLRYPILKNVTLNALGLDREALFPADLPNVHQGETFSLFGRFDQYAPFTMRLSGSNGFKPMDFTFTRNLAEAPRGEKTMATDWAFWKLHHLYSLMQRKEDAPDVLKEIELLRRQYKLKTLY